MQGRMRVLLFHISMPISFIFRFRQNDSIDVLPFSWYTFSMLNISVLNI
jgi:hypothetical protein